MTYDYAADDDGKSEKPPAWDEEGEILIKPKIRVRSYGMAGVQEPKLLLETARALSTRLTNFEIQDAEGVWCRYTDGALVPVKKGKKR